jgi:L-alanine-DL-glutamate epimerase-like enolase superfamily enzyme
MNLTSRRGFLQAAALLSGSGFTILNAKPKPTDIRIEAISFQLEEFKYRAPYKFGGVPVDRATIINVNCRVRTSNGKTANGFGSMPLGNVWAFPSRTMSYDTTLNAMKVLAARINKLTAEYKEYGHPIDLNTALEPAYLQAAAEVSSELKLDAPIPKLCTLVTASAFDAAIHDAFGKVHGRNVYQTYGADLMAKDLSHYLTPDFKGEYLNRYVMANPRPRVFMYHSVGGADAVLESEVTNRLHDGLPNTLAEWIKYNNLTHIKIKLQGDELKWDIERTVNIDRVAQETRPNIDWKYCVDFNERCPNIDYLLEYLRKVKELTPKGFARIQYIEQPTARDLKANRQNVMHEANKLRPIVIDESLVDLESLFLAREMGYTGIALKACKGQSQAMLMAAAGQKYKMFLCVQDLTCPGASLLHSVSIAAHVPGVSGVEHNSRQYMPAANKPWEAKFPGIFKVTDGSFDTRKLNGLGIGVTS